MLFGFDSQKKLFEKLISEDKLSHSYLFYGDEEIGKRLFAESIGRFLETKQWEGNMPLIDYKEILEEEGGSIGINAIREGKSFLWQTPLASSRRTLVINNAEKMTPEAQGALLKISEETPSHGLLLLITHDAEALLPAVRSRMIKLYIPRLAIGQVVSILKDYFAVSEERAQKIAYRSFGRLGRSIKLLHNKQEPVETLGEKIESALITMREKNIVKNSKLMQWLLERETLIKRYRVSENLQTKTVEYYLTK